MKMLLTGKWCDGEGTITVTDPYRGGSVGTVPVATEQQVLDAVSFARSYDFSLMAWDRYEILMRFCAALQDAAEDFAILISSETGKTLKDSRIEVERSYQTFLISAEEAKRINGEVLPIDAVRGVSAGMGLALREPIGVVAAITPFNYPLNLVAHKVGPAIAANCPIILKPSEKAPLTALKMAETMLSVGLPINMLQVVTGNPGEIVPLLTGHPDVAKITFTGGCAVGQQIAREAAGKSICLELGGNDPLIVLAGADLDKAVAAAVDGAFGNNGERCTSTKRIIVVDEIADLFVEEFVRRAEALRVGAPDDPQTDIGPVIDEDAAMEIERRIGQAVDNGAKLLCGGRREGAFIWPTVLDGISPLEYLVVEETFGPVAPIIRVKDYEEAIAVANDNPLGLQSGVFTNNLDLAMDAVRRLQVGAVMINRQPGFRAEHLPFGGVKLSGLGREGVKYAVESMTRIKTVVL